MEVLLGMSKIYRIHSIIITISLILLSNHSNNFITLFALLSFIIYFKDYKKLLPLILLTALLDTFFVAFAGISVNRILVLLYIFLFIFNNLLVHKINVKSLVILLIIILYSILSYFYSFQANFNQILVMILNFIIFFFISIDSISIYDFYHDGKYCFIITLIYLFYDLITVFGGFRFSLSGVNANALAMALLQISIIFAFFSLILNYNKRINFVIFILSVGFLVFTGSRSALFGLLIGLLVLLFMLKKITNIKFYYHYIFMIILLIILFYILYKIFYIMLPKSLLDRYTINSIEESKGSTRTIVWKSIIEYIIPKHFFLGLGIGGSVGNYLFKYTGLKFGAHNIVLAILAENGIIGFLGYSIFFQYYFRRMISNIRIYKVSILSLSMVLAAIANGIGENIYTERYFWIALGLGYGMINYEKGKLDENT